ncbi:FG-GAP-like repeat-containing protein, partial [Phyllobacterium leguminum]
MTAVLATISDAFSFHRNRGNRGAGTGGRRWGWRAVGLMLIAQLALLTGIVSQAQGQTKDTSVKVHLAITPSNTTVGQKVGLMATTVPAVTGTMYFCEATAKLCTDINRIAEAQVINGVAATTYYYPGIGTHVLTARFLGTNGYDAANSSPQTLTVTGKYDTTTTLHAPTGTDPYTLPVTVAGIVPAPVKTVPTGTVDIIDTNANNKKLASVPLSGTASNAMAVRSIQNLATGASPQAVAVADFDGDGRPDVAIPNYVDKTVQIFLGQAGGTMATTPWATLPTPNAPTSAAAADFNNDGYIDLAVGNGNEVTTWGSNGNGTFMDPAHNVFDTSYTAALNLAVADFNHDGYLDFAVPANSDNFVGSVIVFLNGGTGNFTQKGAPIQLGSVQIAAIATGVFTSSGHFDLIASAGQTLLGDGSGGFQPQPAFDASGASVALADFDADGILDVAMAGGEQVVVLQGKGNGSFTQKATAVLSGPMSWPDARVTVGDFNADGHADFAASIYDYSLLNNSTLEVWLGDGNFGFGSQPSAMVTLRGGISDIASADFNGDGIADLVNLNSRSYGFSRVTHEPDTNTATITLGQPSLMRTVTATGVAVDWTGVHEVEAHYEGDDTFVQSDSNTLPMGKVGIVLDIDQTPVAAGKSVTLTATVTPGLSGTVSFCEAAAKLCTDANRLGEAQVFNGKASITFFPRIGTYSLKAHYAGNASTTAASAPQALTVTGQYPTKTTLGKPLGNGPYSIPVTVSSVAPPATPPTGTVDIIDQTNNNVTLGTSSSLSQPTDSLAVQGSTLTVSDIPISLPGGLAGADFNKDGRVDLAVANAAYSRIQIYLGQSDGTFPATPSSIIPYVTIASPVVAGDFTNDGIIDLAVGTEWNTNLYNIAVYTGDGQGGFSDIPITTAATGNLAAFVVSDFDTSGTLDLALVTSTSSQIWLGDGEGKFTAKGSPVEPGNGMKQYGANAAAGDFNNDANPDLLVPQGNGSLVWVLLGDGTGLFQPNPQQINTGANATVQSVAVADFDQNGNLDFTVGVENYNSDSWVAFYQGQGDGKTFVPKPYVTITNTSYQNFNVTVGDFNADGWPDVAAVYYYAMGDAPGQMSFLLGSSSSSHPWTFTPSATVQVGRFSMSPVAGDFNGDGFADVAVVNGHDNNMSVALVQPTVTVTASADVPAPAGDPSSGKHKVAGVYSGDNKLFAKSLPSDPVELAPQKLDTILTVTADPKDNSNAGQPVTLTATFGIKDGDDAQGHNPKGEWVTFTTQNGSVFLGKAQFALDTNTKQYVAILPNVTHLPSGDITVTASYPGDSYFNSMTGSLPYKVGPRATIKMALAVTAASKPVTSVPAGTQVTLTATVTPAVGGTVYFCKVAAPCVGVNRLGEAQLTGGKTVMSFYPGIGTYIFQAQFAGTITDAAATSNTQPLTVTGQHPTTTTLAKPAGNTPPYNLPVTVTGIAPSPLAPTGSVEIIDKTNKDTTLGSAVLAQPAYDVAETTAALAAGKGPYSSTSGDFNADGIEDIAVANRDDKSIGVYLGTHDGKFQLPPISWPTDGNPYPIAAGDFDNNGTLDLATGNGSNLTVFKNPGTGHFNGHVDTGGVSDFQSLVPGDFDNDGNLDVVVVHRSSQQVYLGNGQNGFSPAPAGAFAPGSLPPAYYRSAAGDFNKDGNLDLVVPDGQWNGSIWVLLGDGQGGFQPNPSQSPVQSLDRFAETVAVADFNGDGNLDFAAGVFDKNPSQSGSIFVYQGGTDGKTFTKKAPVPLIGGNWGNYSYYTNVSIAVGDFNADGIADLAASGSANVYVTGTAQVGTWLGDGSWNFTPSTQFGPGAYPLSTIVGDFNGDGFTDVSVVNAKGDNAAVGFLQPTATVTGTAQNVPAPVGTGTHDVLAVYDGDKNFAGSTSGTVPLAAKKLDTTLALRADPPSPVVAWQKVTLKAALGTGGQDLQGQAPSGEVTFSIQNGKQLGTAPFAWDDTTKQYVASLPAQTLPTGNYTIQATYPGDGNFNAPTPQPATLP